MYYILLMYSGPVYNIPDYFSYWINLIFTPIEKFFVFTLYTGSFRSELIVSLEKQVLTAVIYWNIFKPTIFSHYGIFQFISNVSGMPFLKYIKYIFSISQNVNVFTLLYIYMCCCSQTTLPSNLAKMDLTLVFWPTP